jgi:hypothetical protein
MKAPETFSWASFCLVIRDGSGHPLRISENVEQDPDRFGTELQAQWSARLANNLAMRMRSLRTNVQRHWQDALTEETSRLAALQREIEK